LNGHETDPQRTHETNDLNQPMKHERGIQNQLMKRARGAMEVEEEQEVQLKPCAKSAQREYLPLARVHMVGQVKRQVHGHRNSSGYDIRWEWFDECRQEQT
jgi:hypothetical protein